MKIGYEAKRIFHNNTGLGNYSRNLINILNRYYPENEYFLYNPKEDNSEKFEISSHNIFEKKPRSYFDKKFYNLWRQKNIVKDLIKDNISIFHGLSGEIPIGLKKKGIKSIVTIHDLIFMRYPEFYSFFDRKIYFYKFRKSVQNADIVIAISEQTKNDIIQFLGINSSKIKVVYQGCQPVFKDNFSEKEKRYVVKKYHLPKKFLLNVGTIEARKNLLAVIKAIKKLNINLVIVGRETPYVKEIKKYILDHKLEDRVLFLKNVINQELAILYQLATIFVYPSFFEGFGIPIIEALYSKTPVITTKYGCFPEAGGSNSIYIDPNNIFEIESNIKLLLDNSTLRHEMVEKGYQFVQKFNDDQIAKQIIEIYNENI